MVRQFVLEAEPFEFREDAELERRNPVFDDELWEGEVNRSSKTYIAWVQHALNQILGVQLAVDGNLGTNTRSAIRSFQQRSSIAVDGAVSVQTEQRLVQALNGIIQAGSQAVCAKLKKPEILDKFDFDSDQVKPFHLPQIINVAQCIVASQRTPQPIRAIHLIGHTDPVGSDAYNLALGQRRAQQAELHLRENIERLAPGLASKITFSIASRGEKQPVAGNAASSRRVEIHTSTPPPAKRCPIRPLNTTEQAEFNRLSATAQKQFTQVRATIETYTGVACREADRGSRVLLQRGVLRALPNLLPEILNLMRITVLPSGWSLGTVRPLLVGNVLFNLAFPETINQGGTDRLGGRPDPTCFSASTQILLARRFPVTYVRLTIQLATTSRCTFAGGDSIGPLTFRSTSLYKSLESVLLQTAFDTYFSTSARSGKYTPGDELKVHRQVFGPTRPPRFATYTSKSSRVAAFRKAFIINGGTTRPAEIINLCTGNPSGTCGNHTVVLTRVANGRVYFYNPWANEEEKNRMFGTAQVSVSGNGERPAESSMTQADFENQLTTVFHN
jgi:outer membrane protein OmpA-like peptidoglycan-associated protein